MYPRGRLHASSAGAGNDTKSAIEAILLDGIYIEQLREGDGRINIIGYADDNKTVAKYMRLIQEKVGDPILNWVKHDERKQKPVSAFSLAVKNSPVYSTNWDRFIY